MSSSFAYELNELSGGLVSRSVNGASCGSMYAWAACVPYMAITSTGIPTVGACAEAWRGAVTSAAAITRPTVRNVRRCCFMVIKPSLFGVQCPVVARACGHRGGSSIQTTTLELGSPAGG